MRRGSGRRRSWRSGRRRRLVTAATPRPEWQRLNRELRRRRGEVFPYRYHATAIETPTQARNALAYILNNWRRHRADAQAPWRIDPYSSADAFTGWAAPHLYARRDEPLPVVRATTWLLTDGWTRAARAAPIRWNEVPGPDPVP